MHEGELDIDVGLVRRLVGRQFPRWAGQPVVPFPSTGTVNAIFRLGDELCVRLPRVRDWAGDLDKELRWLPALAPRLPLAVPVPVAAGEPDTGYPFRWAVYCWLEGASFDRGLIRDEREAARDLARFVVSLRGIDPSDAPASTRDRPLPARDKETRAAIASAAGMIDAAAVSAAWETALQTPAWTGGPAWTHGDLLPSNILARDGRLAAVIDFGNMGIGDPAVDLIPAWTLFGPAGRAAFREAVGAEEGSWARARGFALHQAVLIIPYYAETNPTFAASAKRTIAELVADAVR